MQRLMLSELCFAADGRLYGEDVPVLGVVIDSRKVFSGALFIALKGQRTDGYNFIENALSAGAAAVLCDRIPQKGKSFILVSDVLKAYHKLAAWYRRRFDLKVLAVTGSAGKTTTKEMCHSVLSARYNTFKTKGNLNSEMGLPLMLFEIMPEHEAAVLEMGMNQAGEIALMSDMAKPSAAVITNIGTSHIENLKSRENILSAKLEVLNGLSPGGMLILNGDDDMLKSAAKTLSHITLWYGLNPDCDFTAIDITEEENITRFTLVCAAGNYPVTINAVGTHNVQNALASVAAGFALGVSPKRGAEALSAYSTISMRQRIYTCKNVRIIEDCYNASPDSMRAALSVLKGFDGGKRIALLGDMLELGSFSEDLHRQVGRMAAECADIVIAYGEKSLFICDEAVKAGLSKQCVFHEEKNKAVHRLLSLVNEGDTVLFKASRGMSAENILEEFCSTLDKQN